MSRATGTAMLLISALVLGTACAPPAPPAHRTAEEERGSPVTTVPAAATEPAAARSIAAEPAAARSIAAEPLAAVGDYGANGDTLIVRERAGRLEALIRGEVYTLVPRDAGAFELAGDGADAGSVLHFARSDDPDRLDHEHAMTATLAGVAHRRLAYSDPSAGTFRIDPVRPVTELRTRARAAAPPVETNHFRAPELVDLATLDPTIRFDIRYATTNNFMGAVFYDEPRAFLQRPAAEALLRAHRRLRDHGFGLLVFDAYRPWYVTWMFWHATPAHQKMFVASPSAGSRHNRGAAVDLTLYDLATGEPVPMPSGYDEFSPRAFPGYPGGTTLQRGHRDQLRRVMEAEGFRVYHAEWWHFDHQDWRRYPILNLTFDQLR